LLESDKGMTENAKAIMNESPLTIFVG